MRGVEEMLGDVGRGWEVWKYAGRCSKVSGSVGRVRGRREVKGRYKMLSTS